MTFSARTDLVDWFLPAPFSPHLDNVLIIHERVGREPLGGFVLEEPEGRF